MAKSNALPLLLVAGGLAVVMTKSKKKRRKRPSFPMMLDVSCNKADPDSFIMEKLLVQVDNLLAESLAEIAGSSPSPESLLGSPESSSIQKNRAFAQAWATAAFKMSVPAGCLKSIGIPSDYGKDANQFGPDFTEWLGEWPGDSEDYFRLLLWALGDSMSATGYRTNMTQDGGASFSSTNRNGLAQALTDWAMR